MREVDGYLDRLALAVCAGKQRRSQAGEHLQCFFN